VYVYTLVKACHGWTWRHAVGGVGREGAHDDDDDDDDDEKDEKDAM
jgi:hypothetical protein